MNLIDQQHNSWMEVVNSLARSAAIKDEVPIGAVIINQDGKVLSTAFNLKEALCDPTAHAEVLAVRRACDLVKSWRLVGATLYANLEPCLMCAAVISQARIQHVVYGAKDPRYGALGSAFSIHNHQSLNHAYQETYLENEQSSAMIKHFFAQRRK